MDRKDVKGDVEIMLKLSTSYVNEKIDFDSYAEKVKKIDEMIQNKTGEGSDFLQWATWPKEYDREEFARIMKDAEYVRKNFDILVVCGIGGSYLGARSAIEALNGTLDSQKFRVIFCGNSFSPYYMSQVLHFLKGKKFAINVISKSGTTTETSIAFRMVRELLEQQIGLKAAKRAVFVTTDKEKGCLHDLALQKGYKSMYVLPSAIGGRYSVLTAVGLFPIACAGIDINNVMQGAYQAMVDFGRNPDIHTNIAYQYAVIRDTMYRNGKVSEMFVAYEPCFTQLGEWWKQLFGESEGKDGKGLLPTSATFSTDLHSLGQFIQQGTHCLFETVLDVKSPTEDIIIPHSHTNLDKLNYLEVKRMSFVYRQAMTGTLQAPHSGGVSSVVLTLDRMDAYSLGYLFYFFMRACAMSAYLLGVNPFNQPGVEVYKKNMFHLLGKEGY